LNILKAKGSSAKYQQIDAILEDRPINNRRANLALIIAAVAVLLSILVMLLKK
jgi:hypothetical protein